MINNALEGVLGSNGPTPMDPMSEMVTKAIAGLQQTQPDLYQQHITDAQKAYQDLLSQQGQQDPIKPKPLIRNKQEALYAALATLLGNVLDSHHTAGTQGVQAFLGARGDAQQQDLQVQQHNQALQAQQLQGKIQSAQVGLQGAQQAQQQNDESLRSAQQQANTDRAFKLNESNKDLAILQNFSSKYSSAAAGAKSAVAAQWRAFEAQKGFPPTAPDNDTVAQDVQQSMMRNNHLASQEWQAAVKPLMNFYGEIDDKTAAGLMTTRNGIAKAYGIDPSQLMPIPTGASLKKQAFDNRKEEFSQKMDFANVQEVNRMADHVANRDLAQQRMSQAMDRYNANRDDRYALAQYNGQLRAYNSANKAANNVAETNIKKLVPKREGLKMAVQNATDEKQRVKFQSQLDQVEGQIGAWRSTQEPMMDLSIMGKDVQIPNAGYQAPVGRGTMPQPQLGQAPAHLGGGSNPTNPGNSPTGPFNPLSGQITPSGTQRGSNNAPVIRPPSRKTVNHNPVIRPPQKGGTVPDGWKVG